MHKPNHLPSEKTTCKNYPEPPSKMTLTTTLGGTKRGLAALNVAPQKYNHRASFKAAPQRELDLKAKSARLLRSKYLA